MQNLSGYNSAITVNLLRNTNKYTNIQHLHDENQHPPHTETLTNTCIASQTKAQYPSHPLHITLHNDQQNPQLSTFPDIPQTSP